MSGSLRAALAMWLASSAGLAQAQAVAMPQAADGNPAGRATPSWQRPATGIADPMAQGPAGAPAAAVRRPAQPAPIVPGPPPPAAVAGDAIPATTAALAAQCAQLGTDAPVVLSVNGRSGDALLYSTLAPNQRVVIHGCNFGDRAAVWLVPVYDGNAVATGVVQTTGAQQTENVFIGELGGPLQPVGGQAGRFVLVLMRVIPYSNVFDSRAAAVCCFSAVASDR